MRFFCYSKRLFVNGNSVSSRQLIRANLKAFQTLALCAIIPFFISACTGNVVREETSAPGKIQTAEDVSGSDSRIEFFGMTYQMGRDSALVGIPDVDVMVVTVGGTSENIASNDSGYYHMDLKFGKRYQIFFSYEGAYTKFVEIDTRFVSDEEREAGYRMPTDMRIESATDEDVFDLYSREPIGKARADAATGILDWDLEYTRKQKEKVRLLEAESV